MSLSLFGFHNYPHDFAVSKTASRWEDCAFLLDFGRRLDRIRWFGKPNRWVGPTIALLVPVVHVGQRTGEFVIGVRSGEPYFIDICKLWDAHYKSDRHLKTEPPEGLQLIADFGKHFPDDC